MIPKKLHYIWFGGNAKPGQVIATVESWKKVMPDYEVIEWNEENFDITFHPWMEKMHRTGKYAFASDWARLHVLYKQGGIYLDTDVELKKPFDPFLHHRMFWGFEYDCYLATCIIGSEPGHPLLNLLLAEYDGREDAPINNAIVTRFFLRHFPSFRLTNTSQLLDDDVQVYAKDYFSIPSSDYSRNFCRHHGSNLWKDGGHHVSLGKRLIRKLLGEKIYYQLVNQNICRVNEFGPIHREHQRRK